MEYRNYQFPEELLSKSLNERLEYFKRLTINHRLMQHAINELLEAIYQPAGASIIMVFGPSGVGKTTLKKLVELKVTEKLLPKLENDKGMIPIAGIELVSPDLGNFNWKDYYRRSLEALHEPMIRNKIDYEKRMDPERAKKRISPFTIRTAPELRKSLEKAFEHRKPLAFIIDEAQHFAKMSTGKRLQDQLDSVKSLANMTNTTHILIGTYDLLSFVNLSGQLSRRSVDLNFPRYTLENKKDIEDFQQIIYSLQCKLPLRDQGDLLEHWEFIYERSVGCVGILKNWLDRCLFGVLKDGKEKIELGDLQKYALSIDKVEKIISEILLGEGMIAGDNEKRKRVQYMLGFDNVEDEIEIKKKTGINVGRRNPTRDQVGF
ncbi:ATP-binding protein [Priestia megaterium]|uniref:ATP-binding protein n=1 Tax=Priestia megaterium TaxID=1404 RepID=UPI0022B8CC53|nr:ATP-binding protein [Priestia megaterium]MCZ8494036.1 ATP-binding protein [Priestia megaterium]